MTPIKQPQAQKIHAFFRPLIVGSTVASQHFETEFSFNITWGAPWMAQISANPTARRDNIFSFLFVKTWETQNNRIRGVRLSKRLVLQTTIETQVKQTVLIYHKIKRDCAFDIKTLSNVSTLDLWTWRNQCRVNFRFSNGIAWLNLVL